jgi:hypothetical protein
LDLITATSNATANTAVSVLVLRLAYAFGMLEGRPAFGFGLVDRGDLRKPTTICANPKPFIEVFGGFFAAVGDPPSGGEYVNAEGGRELREGEGPSNGEDEVVGKGMMNVFKDDVVGGVTTGAEGAGA